MLPKLGVYMVFVPIAVKFAKILSLVVTHMGIIPEVFAGRYKIFVKVPVPAEIVPDAVTLVQLKFPLTSFSTAVTRLLKLFIAVSIVEKLVLTNVPHPVSPTVGINRL